MKKLFHGETMVCSGCGRVEKSEPKTNKEWTAIETPNKITYYCPICWGIMMDAKESLWRRRRD